MTLNIFSRNTVFICCDLRRCSNRNDTATSGTTARSHVYHIDVDPDHN